MWNPFRRLRPRAIALDRDTQHPHSPTAATQPPPAFFERGYRFVCAIPYCDRDAERARDLLEWMRELGGTHHTALLCAPHGINPCMEHRVTSAANQAFEEVFLIRTAFDLPKEGWPTGTVWSFLHIAEHCRKRKWDFWLNEPDCIPTRAGWLTELEAEYHRCGRPFMGYIEPGHPAGFYPRHMTGNGAYNWDVFQHIRADRMDMAWDIAMAEVTTPQCHPTALFHQEFGPLDHPPTFPRQADLDRIPPAAAVFHRNKDGSLITRLRERRAVA